ncbi:MAG: family 78 glycoside hydrolase catalytic domain [Bacteroidales bacterium]|nr:family 78 glycoside hydrolase catalytic domain [Bacteroidales bacterium]
MRIKKVIVLLLFMALLAPVMAQYIGCDAGGGFAETPMLRSRFTLPHPTERVYAAVNSIGYHQLYVNGTRVGDRVMQPAVSQLNKHSLSVNYNISPYLREGENTITLWLGQGWGRIYNMPAVAQAVVYRDAGYRIDTLLVTDSTWQASPSAYSYTGSWQPLQFGGERYDARWKPAWRPATVVRLEGMRVTPQEFAGNRIVDTVWVQTAERLADSGLLLDFGRVVTGWFVVRFVPMDSSKDGDDDMPPSLDSGAVVTMEYLDHLHAVPPHTETDTYISAGSGLDHFVNKFHTHSFRYVRIKGAGVVGALALQISAIDPKEGATFECSDPRLNAVHDMVKYTLSCLTFSGYMVDCPHLERMGYGGDGNSSTMTLQTLYDVRDTYRNWLSSWEDAMDSTGSLPYVAPAFPTGGGPYWSGFIVKAPWRTYLNYGDRTLIDRHYDQMKRWLAYVERYSPDGLLQPWPDEGRMWFLGDWLAPKGIDVKGESALFASNCFVSECLSDMERMARLTGHRKDARAFAARRKRLLADIHKDFYHPETHTYANGSPFDLAYALLAGVVPDRQTRQTVKDRLVADSYGKHNAHIAVGLMGVPVFTEWAIRERQADLMATLLRQPDYPGYLDMISQGATTTWESWDGDRSHIHNCYNGIGIWFYQALAGIRPDPDAPGYKHFFIDPQPCDGITWVKASKPTPFGTIRVEIEDGHMRLTIPEGTTATLFLGTDSARTLPAGEWAVERE